MLRKLFLSIIILSTFASEGGVCYSEELFNYYLANLTYLDVMQNSINSICDFNTNKFNTNKFNTNKFNTNKFNTNKFNTIEKKGTPVAFYKLISQKAIDSKSDNTSYHSETLCIFAITFGLFVLSILFICLRNKLSIATRRMLLCLADSSPPQAFC